MRLPKPSLDFSNGGDSSARRWRGLEDVELATLEWVWRFNHHRLLEPLGYLPPSEFEAQFHRTSTTQESQLVEAALTS